MRYFILHQLSSFSCFIHKSHTIMVLFKIRITKLRVNKYFCLASIKRSLFLSLFHIPFPQDFLKLLTVQCSASHSSSHKKLIVLTNNSSPHLTK